VLPVPKSQEEAAQEQSDRESEATTKRWTIWLAGLTVLVGAGQIYMIKRQANLTEVQNSIMDRQTDIMARQRRIMRNQRTTNDAMLATNKEIERAYVALSLRSISIETSPRSLWNH
jgi:hypothetical protein